MGELEKAMHEFEKLKHGFSVMIEQVIETILIDYNMAMEPFKKQNTKRDLSKYYYKILNIPITPTWSPTQTKWMMENLRIVKMQTRFVIGSSEVIFVVLNLLNLLQAYPFSFCNKSELLLSLSFL